MRCKTSKSVDVDYQLLNVVSVDILLSIADVADTLVDKLVAAFLDIVVFD